MFGITTASRVLRQGKLENLVVPRYAGASFRCGSSKKDNFPLIKNDDIVSRVAEYTNIPAKTVGEVLGALSTVIRQEVAGGNKVKIAKLALFKPRHYPARTLHNPQTRAMMDVAAKDSMAVTLQPFMKRLHDV